MIKNILGLGDNLSPNRANMYSYKFGANQAVSKVDFKNDIVKISKQVAFKKNERATIPATLAFALGVVAAGLSTAVFLVSKIAGNAALASESAIYSEYSTIASAISLIVLRIADKREFSKVIRGVFRLGRK